MKKLIVLFTLSLSLLFWQCNGDRPMDAQDYSKSKSETKTKTNEVKVITDTVVANVTNTLIGKYGKENAQRIEKGVSQAAALWQESDGTDAEFETFCLNHFMASEEERELVFKKISDNFEVLLGHFNKIVLDLRRSMDLDQGEIHPIDYLFGGYSPGAHLADDFYRNKIAFIMVLNFPFYSLEEKMKLGPNWSRKEWAYARMGDIYTARVPAALNQDYAKINSDADAYISEYNIFAGHLMNDKGETLFPRDLKLLVHWNLRDELKSQYGAQRGLEKQKMIYAVMKRIISQEIPENVINNDQLEWNPLQNKVYKAGKEIEVKPEPDTRYQHLLNNFKALKAIDPFYPEAMNTYIKRKFDGEMEIPQSEVEALFIKFVSSPQVKQVAQLIRSRLNRDLEPFDIWYDGFKARSGVAEEKLNLMAKKRYPTAKDLEEDLPNILLKLGFSKEKAEFLASKITVEAARGSGHAAGAEMKAGKAYLRTRVGKDGMNYKGYSIAIHEFGHNVEQTITLHDVDYYTMNGVPNTAFTEALAFIFQKRDLELLGIKETNEDKKHLLALDTFWSVYEIMGVSLVDMNVWKWLYDNPEANAQQLKEAVIRIAIDVWNNYFADAIGVKDQPILAIYSHMISYPLYLSAYSYGHLIDFQLEQYLEGKDLAAEVGRMFARGRLIPQLWMKEALGKEIAFEPLLQETDEALKKVK